MRRLLLLTLVATAVLVTTPAAGATQAAPAGAAPVETTRVVDTGAEFRAALVALSADESGPHRIVLAADIAIGDDLVPEYTSHQPLTVDGRGHTLRGSARELLNGQVASTLTIQDLTMTGAANGVLWWGRIVVRDSTFVRIGRGHGLVAGQVLYAVGGGGVPAGIVTTDTRFIDNRARSGVLNSAGSVVAIRTSFRANDSQNSIVSAVGNVRLIGNDISRNLTRIGSVVRSGRGAIELVRSEVRRNTRIGPAPTIQSRTTSVSLVDSVLSGNQVLGGGRRNVAVETEDFVADHAVIDHQGRDCWISESAQVTASVVDRTCRST